MTPRWFLVVTDLFQDGYIEIIYSAQWESCVPIRWSNEMDAYNLNSSFGTKDLSEYVHKRRDSFHFKKAWYDYGMANI